MTQRTMISCIIGHSVKLDRMTKAEQDEHVIYNAFVLRRIDGVEPSIAAIIHEDHIYDRDGNHFDDDV